MASPGHSRIIALGLLLAAAGAGGYLLWPPGQAASVVGVVRATETRVAPEVGGQLAAIKVQKGDQVRAGDVVAELSALDLTASVAQARAVLAAATADRDHVYAGVRDEEIASLAGENVHAGQPVLAIQETGKDWLSFNAREDLLHGLTVGAMVDVWRQGKRETMPAAVTELRPIGSFATWQAERAVGDHDRNTLRLRLDLQGDPTGFEPGMTVWFVR